MIRVEPHPLVEIVALTVVFPKPLGILGVPDTVAALLVPGASAPMTADDSVRSAVRDLLRHGGYKPTGRGKPASEYLLKAVAEGGLGSINAAVDAGNAASLHSGLPISIVDLDRAVAPFVVRVAGPGSAYVFNTAGHAIDLEGLIGLEDADGPCANAVKDSQRTKTTAETTRILAVVWGTRALPGRAAATAGWIATLLTNSGGQPATLSIEA